MLYLSDLEEALGSLDSVNMVSAFDLDKFNIKSELEDIEDVLDPYLSLLSPLDRSLFDMYYVNKAKTEFIASYFEVSSTAIYKRIRAINIKLRLVIYLNMNQEQLFRFLRTNFIKDTQTAEYITQFIFYRTSKVGSEEGLNFKAIQQIQDLLKEASKSSSGNINNHTIKMIKRNCKRHRAIINLRRIVSVIQFIIDAKAYRYNIFRGSLSGTYHY